MSEGEKPKEFRQPRKAPYSIDREFEDVTNEWNVDIQFTRLKRLLERNGRKLEDSSVLELGSGAGALYKRLKDEGVDIIGFDANPRDRMQKVAVKGRIEDMQFDDNTFDVAVSCALLDSEVYEQDLDAMEEEIARVLKPGGLYVEFSSWDALPGKKLEIVSEGTFERVYRKQ
jgi:ubiquinone/menaquinone biosynthesis C-methylase UbiE